MIQTQNISSDIRYLILTQLFIEMYIFIDWDLLVQGCVGTLDYLKVDLLWCSAVPMSWLIGLGEADLIPKAMTLNHNTGH